ncbi:MAG: polysaccharide deacetylase family protein [Nitrososphaeraceae archaeon]
MITRISMVLLIALGLFAHTIILELYYSGAAYAAYTPCNCVIFAMDDIADYGLNKVQLATMDYFISENLPFTASIVVSQLANSSNLEVFHKVEEGLDKNLFELAIHGYRHVHYSQLTREEQKNDFSIANARLEYLFGKRADIFIPPFNDFNLHTIEAMSDLNIHLFSTHADAESRTANPYKSQMLVTTNNSKLEVSIVDDQKPLVYHAPFLASFLRLRTEGVFGDRSVEESLKLIDEGIAKYGFAHVRLHPSDFNQVNETTGKPINEVDTTRFEHLSKLVDSLKDRNIKIASFSDIYPNSSNALVEH